MNGVTDIHPGAVLESLLDNGGRLPSEPIDGDQEGGHQS